MDKELQTEQKRVNEVIKEINSQKEKIVKESGQVGEEVLSLRQTFWEDVTVNLDDPDDINETAASLRQQAELLGERERTRGQMTRQMRILERLRYSPYFGRIDFHEAGESHSDKIYIGIASLMDEQKENFLIYDWRAPISSVYYDYSPGPAVYETPEGMITGELELKRQYLIRGGKITGMFDTGVTIGDEMLQEVLGNQASTQMKSIVATIQSDQNKIIRNEKSRYLIVQGVAGSGKTSAALQRVAYLLYRYRGTLSSENIMLFSPNPLFNSYVATVLPELGEENMRQATFMEYLNHRIGSAYKLEDSFDQMEYLLSNEDSPEYKARVAGIRYKSGLKFKQQIDHYSEKLSQGGIAFKDIRFRKRVLVSRGEIGSFFYSLPRDISIPNRIQQVRDWLFKQLRKEMKVEQGKPWVEEQIQFLEKEDYIEAFKKLEEKKQYQENTFDDFDREQKLLAEMVVKNKFKPLFNGVKKLRFIDRMANYKQLFRSQISDGTLPAEWTQICKQTLRKLDDGCIQWEDAAPFVYLQDLLEGRASGTGVKHIFIDEAQDYTPFQFEFLNMLFPYSKMTLLGDFNQAIFSGATGSLTVMTEDLEEEGIERITLNRTYRSTKEIVEFTSELLEDGQDIEAFAREGEKPVVTLLTGNGQLREAILSTIKGLQQEGHRTIAVICRTAKESMEAYSLLKSIQVRLIEKGTVSFEPGILVIPAYLAKGIEFDAVIMFDASQYRHERERKLFYTACTRAMHKLLLFCTDGVSPLMEKVPESVYTKVESSQKPE
ncbi:helicase [Bacillus sp. FJAT-27225]|uniref:RNA polymerase recycling motor HelD n=1 Tax=Bacillus sp. FJAT-27225 TaxID=1743144 RepID=UPI00080C2629|nr:RNA polymerase recycling motor HelD [Bacillus sp. FJAT-27225]OCA90596.1 helicase [Bacillus sp. FJAT-27225]